MRRFAKGPVLVLLILVAASALFAGTPDKNPLDIQAIDEWKSIRSTALTHDGQWMAYYLNPNDGDSQVILRAVNDTTEYTFKTGKTRSGRLAFSEDSQWLAFMRYPTKAEAEKAKKSKKPAKNKMVLVR